MREHFVYRWELLCDATLRTLTSFDTIRNWIFWLLTSPFGYVVYAWRKGWDVAMIDAGVAMYMVGPTILGGLVIFLWNMFTAPGIRDKEQAKKIAAQEALLHPPAYSNFRPAIERLVRNYDYGIDTPNDRFLYYVSIENLEGLGVSKADLRHLSRRGIIKFYEHLPRPGQSGISLRETEIIDSKTVFYLTDAGRQWASGTFGLKIQATNSA